MKKTLFESIGISLFTGTIFGLFVFIGTFAGNFMWWHQLKQDSVYIAGVLSIVTFLFLALILGFLGLKLIEKGNK